MGFKFNLEKGFKQFLVKTAVFIVLFIVFSFIIGQKIVSSSLLSDFGIAIYGRMGYILLFSIAGFILLYRERLLKIESSKYKIRDYFVLILSIILLASFYFLELNIEKIEATFLNVVLVHVLFLAAFLSLFLGIYGLSFIYNFIKKFRKELLYFLIFGVVTGSLMELVWRAWPYLSSAVSKIVYFLLKLVTDNVRVIPPRTIIVGKFAAEIAEACSGIYSIFLFTALYLFIVLLDWKKINKKKAAILFVPAVVGAFFINVLRVFLLMVVGAFVSGEIAMGMYHSYTGMIFFLIYFALFWILFYKWMKDEKTSWIPKDPLYRNSIYLMMSMLVMAFFGFFFWMMNARIFTAEQVGLATTIISISTLIVSFSGLGLGNGIIRYLPNSKVPNKKINTCFTLITVVTIIASSIFLLSVNEISPRLIFIKENVILSFIFIIFMIFSSWNSLIESVFIAYRSTKYILLKNSVFSVLKLVFPFLLVSLGAYGIFSSWMIALSIGFIVVFIILAYKFSYKPKFVFHDSIIRKIGRYSFGNYVAGFIGSLPTLLLPLIITNSLHPEITAYYYMAMMIANLLFMVPNATSSSLFAEGSHNQKELKKHVKRSVKLISLFIIPAIIIIIFFGKYLLLLFGKAYSDEGFQFLNLLAISGVFVSINTVFTSVFKVQKKIKETVYRSLLGTLMILSLSFLFIHIGLGLIGIGWAWLIGQVVISLFFVFMWLSGR